jgi:mannan endo-1,4-beta-mannosidase
MYRNYDGANSTYGDTKVYAESNNSPQSSVYASISGSSNATLHVIVINKDYDNPMNANISISSSANYTTAKVYAFDSTTSTIASKAQVSISNNAFTYSLPKLSVYHFLLTSNGTTTPVTTPAPTTSPAAKGDVNGNGSIDIVDALLIAQFYVGLISGFPC